LPVSPAQQQFGPSRRVRELWCVCGRRSGKSRIAAAIAVYLALFIKHRLARGETGMCLVLAGSMDQARAVFGYVRGLLEATPVLWAEVVAVKRFEIELKNGVVLGVHSNSFRTVRGRTLIGCVFDETAFWRDETSAQPDIETYRAVLPSLATTNGMLIGISTPYRKFGLLHLKLAVSTNTARRIDEGAIDGVWLRRQFQRPAIFDRTVDQLIIEESGNVAAKFSIPFSHSAGRIGFTIATILAKTTMTCCWCRVHPISSIRRCLMR
jgi:hypothetical protein